MCRLVEKTQEAQAEDQWWTAVLVTNPLALKSNRCYEDDQLRYQRRRETSAGRDLEGITHDTTVFLR